MPFSIENRPGVRRQHRRGPQATICAAMLALASGGCDAGKRTAPAGLVRLSDDEVKSLDPQKISDLTSLRVAEDQFEGLTRHRGDGQAELGLAQAVNCTADALACRFTLRPGLRFSDGQPITATIFALGFARLRDPKTTAPNAKLFEGIESIAAEGPGTVIITLRRPLPWLLLAAAGYGLARPLVFDVRFNSGGDHRRIAVALAAMWQPYGVEARLLNSEATLHFAALRLGDFQLARSGWIADVPRPENFLSVHLSGAGAVNYSGFADPEYDRLVAGALDTVDPAPRAALLRAAEERLLRAAPILPIYHYVSRTLVAPDVRGWQDNPMNVHPSRLLHRVPR
jgi:ABC-type oligopeptide transport system substrate-binding subunit